MDLDKLSTNVRQLFLKILIGSVMASKQRTTEKLEELYRLRKQKVKTLFCRNKVTSSLMRIPRSVVAFCVASSLGELENVTRV